MATEPEITLDPYPGLPPGAFFAEHLPPVAIATKGGIDDGVWSAAVNLYLTVIDPTTGKPYHGHALEDVARGGVGVAAVTCQGLATKYSANSDEQATNRELAVAKHLAEAVEHSQIADGVLNEPLTGPDGGVLDGLQLQQLHREDEELARQRVQEGDSRHTERPWPGSWRVLATMLLGGLDLVLLWKPLLNLSFEASSGSVFRWLIAAAATGLQVFGIEWSARTFVKAERVCVDRRAAAGDYNRMLRTKPAARSAPSAPQIAEAEQHLAHAYWLLVLVATFVAMIGGVRIAVLARLADFVSLQAVLYGAPIGLILGLAVVLMARMYCRGNLLGYRLAKERKALAVLTNRHRYAIGVVSAARQRAITALNDARTHSEHAEGLREKTLNDFRAAVQLGWSWLGLPEADLDLVEFGTRATPPSPVQNNRADLADRLDKVNDWLAKRPSVVNGTPPSPTPGAPQLMAAPHVPLDQPGGGRAMVISKRGVDLPTSSAPPYLLMLAGAAAVVLATVVTAFVTPNPNSDSSGSALPGVHHVLGYPPREL
ncbi:hypothetical protein [Kutzneria kofuensis]|uniref:Uncharacterized protein n=1 Tax=Kutzneria kofuensis TaxID=103725 RepID=A0A7W9KGS9_9PSEU|nr:hypothetical protein [Kutzneria kofuensis]MBB5892316.1 hypothetical protein [Kutzneria kofuensis]